MTKLVGIAGRRRETYNVILTDASVQMCRDGAGEIYDSYWVRIGVNIILDAGLILHQPCFSSH